MRTAFVILSSLCLIAFPLAVAKAQLDPFDSYGAISWELEKVHLDNFAIALQRNPDLIGYIVVYAGRRACFDAAKDRALRAKQYVVKTRGIQESRVKWIDGGHREELTVILQPVPPDAPELTASPSIKPSDVILKNCKPKASKRKCGC